MVDGHVNQLFRARFNVAGQGMFLLAIIFAVLVFLLGGASRADAQSQLLLRLLSIAVGAVALTGIQRQQIAQGRVPLQCLAAIAVLILLQLMPLPPQLWLALPGRESFRDLIQLAETQSVWRPLSLTPDLTLNSLLSLLPAFATALLLCRLPGHAARSLLTPLMVLIICSGILGLLQISSGGSGPYLYRITNSGAAVGLFANRNHQGMLLALALPILAAFAASRARDQAEPWRFWLAVGLAIFIIPLIIVTGSRAALVLALVGIGAGWLLGSSSVQHLHKRSRKRSFPVSTLLWIGGVVLVGVAAISSRATAIQRLFSEDVSQEVRVSLFRPIFDMGMKYFPFGSGFGSFVDTFKFDEPLSNLSGTYLNHAHNDFLEFFVEGGLPALIFVLVFVLWYASRSIAIWRRQPQSERVLYARLGSVLLGMLALASLADYPLRTPIFMFVFVLSLFWLARDERPLRP